MGFHGLNLIIGLEDFKNEYGARRVRIVIESVWMIMRNHSELLPSSTNETRDQVENRSVSDAGQKCILVLSNLLSKSTATSLPMILNVLLDVCEKNSWNPKSLCMFFFGSVALNVPSQFLFVVISSIFRHLESAKYSENTHATLLFCIYQILSHNRGPLGFSALELIKSLMSQAKVSTANSNISLPVILSWSAMSNLPEPVSMAVFCMLAVAQYTAFMTQRYDILTYVIRKNFRIALDSLRTPYDNSRETSFSDRQSIITETVNPASFQFLQIIWIFLSGAFSDVTKPSKFSLIQSPHSFFEKIFYILNIDDRDTLANCLYVILQMLTCSSISVKELIKYDTTMFYVDHYLSKLCDALMNESSTLPHFVFAYRIFKTFSKLSKPCFIHTVACIRSIRSQLNSIDASKAVYCTLMECLLLQTFSESYTKIDVFEFKDLTAEMADSQVYVNLFESGEISTLNRSFGENHFEFEPDQAVITRIYKNVRFFTLEESNKLLAEFVPTAYDLKGKYLYIYSTYCFLEKSSKIETRQLSSFQDSFRAQPSRNQDMSSKRSFLSLNIGSTSNRSMQAVTSPKAYTENIYVNSITYNNLLLIMC